MDSYSKLKDMLCEELDEIVNTGHISPSDLEAVHLLTDTIKNVNKIESFEGAGYSREGSSYGRDGAWNAMGRYTYANDPYMNSYGRSGEHYVRAHYSRAGSDREMMMDRLTDMINEQSISKDDKMALKKALEVLRR